MRVQDSIAEQTSVEPDMQQLPINSRPSREFPLRDQEHTLLEVNDNVPESTYERYRSVVARVLQVFLMSWVVVNSVYLAVMTSRRFICEVQKFKAVLHFGGWCNFILYTNYASYKDI